MVFMVIANVMLSTATAILSILLISNKKALKAAAKKKRNRPATSAESVLRAKNEQKKQQNFLRYNGDEQPQIYGDRDGE